MPELFSDTTKIAGIDYSHDVETGATSYTVRWFVRTEAELPTVGEPTYNGLPLKERNATNWEPDNNDLGFQLDLTYAGEEATDDYEETWTFKNSFVEKSVESLPRIQKVILDYGGQVQDDGTITWPLQTEETGKNLTLGLQKALADEKAANPLFGERTRTVFFSIAVRKYFSTTIDPAFENIGKVFDELPGTGPKINFEDGQNWIKTAPQPVQSGDGWLITEEYWLSDIGGHKRGLNEYINGST